ncbi:sugar ABC transporter ATP-binding protein [Ornithinimicrobium sediminis]|uniref:sugar ABC transporter ATP-binding protein n=1 Tax=Ornithinimicrobium sediminis TaxID=2904603 RepID=UPI001E417395|nr:sugar ABC transporter ATP-binding protein [Ornithinimicrobium sediminis]MCE0487382.1 sugar ABC transporter ATP-binding protein [Ornithinimicrobium sediminis]
MSPLLEIRDVSKGFPGVQALQDVNLVLDRGEVLALVGENGAGKSTLMKILSGIYTKDSGSIHIDGEPVDIAGPREAQALGISIIHQEMNLLPHLTVAQNMYIGREPRLGPLLKERALRRQAEQLLADLGIQLPVSAVVGDLTVAQQQMVEIAKALSFDSTKILVMDEPTSAISLSETQVLFRLITSLRERGVGIVYISHRMEELRQIADRVTVLRDGTYVGTKAIDDVTEEEIIAMMVGRELSGHHDQRQAVQRHPDDVVLSVRGLSTKRLLKDVSFDLHRGEILGFAGLMGAGRTETARAIIGADPSTAGSITLHGKDVKITGPDKAVELGIGYLPEDRKRHGLMLDQDVTFNMVMSSLRAVRGPLGFLRKDKAQQVTRSFIDSLRIKTPSTRATVKNLSGGNQQKIVIGKWLARDCDVLIFDEPTRGIDVGAKEEIYKLLNELAQRGKAVMLISSELPEVLRLSHRVVVMSAGQVTGQLDNDEADQEKVMALATRNIDREAA